MSFAIKELWSVLKTLPLTVFLHLPSFLCIFHFGTLTVCFPAQHESTHLTCFSFLWKQYKIVGSRCSGWPEVSGGGVKHVVWGALWPGILDGQMLYWMPINGKSIIMLTNCLCVLESFSLQPKECQKLFLHSLLYFTVHQLSFLSGRHMHTSGVKYQRFIWEG